MKMLSMGGPTSTRAASKTAAGNPTGEPTPTGSGPELFGKLSWSPRRRTIALDQSRDLQMFSLTVSEVRASWGKVRVVEPGSGLWSLPVSRCECVSGVWGEAAASVRRMCARLRIATRWSLSCEVSVRGAWCVEGYIYTLSASPSPSLAPVSPATSFIAHPTSTHIY